MFVNNSVKCGPIFEILSFVGKFPVYTLQRFPPHLQYGTIPCDFQNVGLQAPK